MTQIKYVQTCNYISHISCFTVLYWITILNYRLTKCVTHIYLFWLYLRIIKWLIIILITIWYMYSMNIIQDCKLCVTNFNNMYSLNLFHLLISTVVLRTWLIWRSHISYNIIFVHIYNWIALFYLGKGHEIWKRTRHCG